ncbi:GNAT family N-acetyltransferase [Paraburkholderia sp. BL21I4N1]|uniref:GNAT family N-acetyltransferase n=1 Tax=Paraburkholderia sp. BL21I4N1 TaxID=1938801 RepID=UPI000CFD1E02|nr:GNAT family N-acetyltransferase [Paraburkholderia sp. BL21I4N1]PQV49370.1 L-amino acid N-acyltransferase YncA [Paraburkholderia sp. BL21I4N1]
MLVDIREAMVVDAQAIAEIHVSSWQSAYAGIMPPSFLAALSVDKRARSWRDALESRRISVALAYTAGQLAGWVAYGKCRDTDKDASWGEIEAIYLDPSQYGQGIGALLMQHACRSLDEMGYTHALLWVLTKNCRARTFYERVGFVADDRTREFELGGSVLCEIRYQRLGGSY